MIPCERRKCEAQFCAGIEQPRFGSPNRNAETSGDFVVRVSLDVVHDEHRAQLLRQRVDRGVLGTKAPAVQHVVEIADVEFLIDLATRVYVDDEVKRYAVALAQATRSAADLIDPTLASYIELGSSPRGSIALQQASRALALLHGRSYATPDDVRSLCHVVFRHRVRRWDLPLLSV